MAAGLPLLGGAPDPRKGNNQPFDVQAAIDSLLKKQFGSGAFVNGEFSAQAAIDANLRDRFGAEAFPDGNFDPQGAINSILRGQFGPSVFGDNSGDDEGNAPPPGPPPNQFGTFNNFDPGPFGPTFNADPSPGGFSPGEFGPGFNRPAGIPVEDPSPPGLRIPSPTGFGNTPSVGGTAGKLLRNAPPNEGVNQRRFAGSDLSNFLRRADRGTA